MNVREKNLVAGGKEMRINFNGFLKIAVEGYLNEVCGMLYSKNLYSDKEEWVVFPCANISENPTNEWIPDSKELIKIKKKADSLGLIKIGNIHTHPYDGDEDLDKLNHYVQPSEKDLYYAKKFRDLVRIILLVKKDGGIMNSFIHDKYGNKIDIYLESIEEDSQDKQKGNKKMKRKDRVRVYLEMPITRLLGIIERERKEILGIELEIVDNWIKNKRCKCSKHPDIQSKRISLNCNHLNKKIEKEIGQRNREFDLKSNILIFKIMRKQKFFKEIFTIFKINSQNIKITKESKIKK